jgi:hypothetical protein
LTLGIGVKDDLSTAQPAVPACNSERHVARATYNGGRLLGPHNFFGFGGDHNDDANKHNNHNDQDNRSWYGLLCSGERDGPQPYRLDGQH